jgi:serine/threonine protein kinase
MEKAGKLLEAEGYALVSSDVDRGTHSVVYHCRVMRPPSPSPPQTKDEEERDEKPQTEITAASTPTPPPPEVGQLVRVKVLNESLPLPRHLTNFQHEHKVVEALVASGVPGVVKVVARLSRPGLEALVLEDFGGRSLDQWLERDGPLAGDMPTFLHLALSIARTLGHVHSRSVVHRDIKVPPRGPSLPLMLPSR